jgi:hypothetical protein
MTFLLAHRNILHAVVTGICAGSFCVRTGLSFIYFWYSVPTRETRSSDRVHGMNIVILSTGF